MPIPNHSEFGERKKKRAVRVAFRFCVVVHEVTIRITVCTCMLLAALHAKHTGKKLLCFGREECEITCYFVTDKEFSS